MSWTDERVDQLKNLWTEGLSASQIARALEISSEELYVRAGILDERDEHPDLISEIRREPDLTEDQKKTLIYIYASFRRENGAGDEDAALGGGAGD